MFYAQVLGDVIFAAIQVKIHMRLAYINEHDVVPEQATVTVAKKNDCTQMDALVVMQEADWFCM
jgi:hypothetical protein